MSRPLRNLVAGLCALALVFLAGVGGYVSAGWPLPDAVCLVVPTVFTVTTIILGSTLPDFTDRLFPKRKIPYHDAVST